MMSPAMAPRRPQSEEMLSLLERHKIQVLLDAAFSALLSPRGPVFPSIPFGVFSARAASHTLTTSVSIASVASVDPQWPHHTL